MCSHFANTVTIWRTAAGAGYWFWLDPALVHSGCCDRDSASVIIFFHTISSHSRLLRSGLYFFDREYNLRCTLAACNFSQRFCRIDAAFCAALPCVCVYFSMLVRSSVVSFLFFSLLIFFLLFIFPFLTSVSSIPLAWSTPFVIRSFRYAVV